jgi:hypothetical protein
MPMKNLVEACPTHQVKLAFGGVLWLHELSGLGGEILEDLI